MGDGAPSATAERRAADARLILQAAEKLVRAGIPNLKLYFMVGLPTETVYGLAANAADPAAFAQAEGPKVRELTIPPARGALRRWPTTMSGKYNRSEARRSARRTEAAISMATSSKAEPSPRPSRARRPR